MKNEKKEKKENIIEIGKELIIKKGFSHTSVEDITKKVGISKGSFYTYFKSKDDLILQTIEDKISKYKMESDDILKDDITFKESLEKHIKNHVMKPFEDITFFLFIRCALKEINLLREDTKKILSNIIFSRNIGILSILKKYKDDIDASTEEEMVSLSRVIVAILDSYFEKIFDFFLFEGEKDIPKLENNLKNIDTEKEIEYINKISLKILLKI